MRNHSLLFLLLFGLTLSPSADAAAQTLSTPRDFPKIDSQQQWLKRRRAIREQILVSSGLWPMPEKTPLKATVFGRIDRGDYSVEKVYFQSYPGFYVAGNLYRPLGRGPGPFPGIINPHGHWEHGRFENTDIGNIPARCINFAKQGMIAFSYDMVGYNDTHFPEMSPSALFSDKHVSFASNGPAPLLWSVTLMGLQTWDSVRALDFLVSLPDVDKTQLACTGASGGGTQTFILGAIDDRLAAQAPVVMVSHTMQGGCLCENMPGLRVEFSNVEIAAAAAPRPQILVSDTRDWTRTTLTMEGPAIKHIYELFQAPDNLRYVRYDFVHNYNQTSRQAVYQWFDKCLLLQPDQPVTEQPFQKEPDQDLIVFPDGKPPADAVTQKELVQYLIKSHKDQLESLNPANKGALEKYKTVMQPAWTRTLQLDPAEELDASSLLHFTPAHPEAGAVTIVLAHPAGKAPFVDSSGEPAGLARKFLDSGFDVVIAADAGKPANSNQTSIFYTTYNRTRLQERVGYLAGVCGDIKHKNGNRRVLLCGCGGAGLWAELAAPAADGVIADCGHVDVSDDQAMLDPDLFCPGIRNIDTFAGAAILAAPHPLVLHNVARGFSTASLRASYRLLRAGKMLKAQAKPMNDEQIVAAALSMQPH